MLQVISIGALMGKYGGLSLQMMMYEVFCSGRSPRLPISPNKQLIAGDLIKNTKDIIRRIALVV
jgi:hypothetical protein